MRQGCSPCPLPRRSSLSISTTRVSRVACHEYSSDPIRTLVTALGLPKYCRRDCVKVTSSLHSATLASLMCRAAKTANRYLPQKPPSCGRSCGLMGDPFEETDHRHVILCISRGEEGGNPRKEERNPTTYDPAYTPPPWGLKLHERIMSLRRLEPE